MEYIHGQLFERSVESGCGSVTCLPGALTMLRFSAFRKMAKYYFADKAEQCDDLFDYGKCHLGEDRWLTHLFMIGARERYQIQMCTGAFCKTEAVQTYKSLLKQRRRWFLGFITNEVCMLTDIRLWVRYPLLCVVRFMNNTIRTTALLFFVMVLSIITTSNKISNLPVGFIAVSLGLNWLLMIYFGAKLKRFKVWAYPLMFIINPFFNWVYMVYGTCSLFFSSRNVQLTGSAGIFTAGQRTWGGPRADAGAADAHTTPQQAIEHAMATGDDLNVVPETFKPAAEARHPEKPVATVPVLPTESIEGRFAPAEGLPGGWYLHGAVDSGVILPNTAMSDLTAPHMPIVSRNSFDSTVSGVSGINSVYIPRQVEIIMNEKDRHKYFFAQQAQRAPTGAYMNIENLDHGRVYEMTDEMDRKGIWSDNVDELSSEDEPLQSSTSHPRYQRNYIPSRGVSPGVSPDYAPTRSNRQSNYHNSDDLNKEAQNFSLPAAAHPYKNSPRASQTDRKASPISTVPLIRFPTGEERESIEMQQRPQPQETLPLDGSQSPDTASVAQAGSNQPLMTGEADALEWESTGLRAQRSKKVYKLWVRK